MEHPHTGVHLADGVTSQLADGDDDDERDDFQDPYGLTEDELFDPTGPEDEASVIALAELLGACERLHQRRVELGMSLAEVADRACCEPGGLEDLDDGDLMAPLETLAYYAAGVGVDLRWAFTGDGLVEP